MFNLPLGVIEVMSQISTTLPSSASATKPQLLVSPTCLAEIAGGKKALWCCLPVVLGPQNSISSACRFLLHHRLDHWWSQFNKLRLEVLRMHHDKNLHCLIIISICTI
ncbi:unnamed protein product [Durusdinium trenchii]|uniref:Uncharacterized protein n=1 Tax=Durusdinium trenchii TaxID=1381693 RepID=A0ABP0SH23_9DINO